jgi:hypothetical protein
MRIVDPGHVYDLWQLGSDEPQRLTHVKRSGGAITYAEEWPGVQTQEVMRAEIDRMKYLNSVIPCVETQDAIWHARMVIFTFEARAWRRKQEGKNRLKPQHDDTARPRSWRSLPFDDVPFNEHLIELRPIGEDGHIIIVDLFLGDG